MKQGDKYISYSDVVAEIVKHCPKSGKRLLEQWRNILLGVHDLKLYRADEEGRIIEEFKSSELTNLEP